jgi:hypothetical protein
MEVSKHTVEGGEREKKKEERKGRKVGGLLRMRMLGWMHASRRRTFLETGKKKEKTRKK